MRERFRASDYRFIAACLALLAATTWYSVRNFYRAFPEASIDFRVNRDEAQGVALRFLAGQGYRTERYREASRFSYDDDAKTFLEREAGLEQANRIMGTRVRLWRWSCRWFRPLQKEEYRVDVTPAGQLAGFEHLLPEDAARPAVTPDAARTLAESFLRQRLGRDPASLDFVETAEIARPRRVDRFFTWKERDFSLKDATIRLEVTLAGNEVTAYREYLKIPEQWTRDYGRLRSKNEMATYVDMAFLAALMLGLAATILMRVRVQDVRWRQATVIGLVGAALSFLASMNQFPLDFYGYSTTDSYASFVSTEVLQAAMSALGYGGLLFLLAAGAEPLYRAALPGRISLGNLFRPRGLRSKRFFLGALLGVSLTGAFIAYQTAFYITAYKHGAWSPADVPYTDLLNTKLPWLFVLFGGFFPAVSEEFLFRMFAIPFLRKVTRSLAIGLVLAAFIWGFGHSAYPQQPFYIRGVEVGIGGIILGLVMLRWGILPALVWHYSVDAMYSAMLLLRSHSMYFKLSGAASAGIVLLPVVVALAAYWMRGGFEPETGLLNADERQPEPEPAVAPPPASEAITYRPLATRWRLAAAVLGVVCLGALLVPATRFGESPAFKLSSGEARASADAFLRSQGIASGGFQAVTYPDTRWGGDDSLTAKYFLERRPSAAVSALFARHRPVNYWATRYFQPLQQEEVLIGVQPETGKAIGFRHVIPEDRAGADLPPEAAQRIASTFAASQGWDTGAMVLKESSSEKKKARRDYSLVWEAPPGDPRNVGDARYRLAIGVSGDRATSARVYWKLPEAWTRNRDRQNALSILALLFRVAAIAGLMVAGIWLVVRNTRQGLIRWRTVAGLAAAPAVLTAVEPLLSMRLALKSYPTTIPLETFQAVTYLTAGMAVIVAFVMMAGAAALITSYFPKALPSLKAENRRALALDAAAGLAGAVGLIVALGRLKAVLLGIFHAQAFYTIPNPDLIATPAPALAVLANAVRVVLAGAAALAVIAIVVRRAKGWVIAAAAVVALFAFLPGDVRTPGEFALELGLAAAQLIVAVFFCRWIARENYLAYALVLWVIALRGPLEQFAGTPNPALHVQAWVVAAALAGAVVWALYPAFARRAGEKRAEAA